MAHSNKQFSREFIALAEIITMIHRRTFSLYYRQCIKKGDEEGEEAEREVLGIFGAKGVWGKIDGSSKENRWKVRW
jgi:hypothetical protein